MVKASLLVLALAAVACGSDATSVTNALETATTKGETISTTSATNPTTLATTGAASGSSTFVAEVWADNWFSLAINGTVVGEDSVPITTERSFNAETISFEATYPLTISVVAKDFKENDTGLEYIGTDRQQMGDGGIILQITDTATGRVVAVSDAAWKVLSIHRAPLNTECEGAAAPADTCQSEVMDEPSDWDQPDFDDSAWASASVFSEADVSPKDGYTQVNWDPMAELIWGADLEVDNTILMRVTVSG